MQEDVLNYLKEEENISEVVAELMLEKLLRYKDVFEEFCFYLKTNIVPSEEDGAICVEGYTARKLVENYPLKVLGSYTYLISLRDDKNRALEHLKKGLPNKDSKPTHFKLDLYWGQMKKEQEKNNYIRIDENVIKVKYKNILKIWNDKNLSKQIEDKIKEKHIYTLIDLLTKKRVGGQIKGSNKIITIDLEQLSVSLDCNYEEAELNMFFYECYKDISNILAPILNEKINIEKEDSE